MQWTCQNHYLISFARRNKKYSIKYQQVIRFASKL
jgi:hypothetical protein